MSQFSSRGATGNPMAMVELGVRHALPPPANTPTGHGTDLIFGYANGNSGCLDLNGHSQELNSIGSMNRGLGANYCGGVTNTGGALSTLSINNTKADFINARFDAVIG